MMMMKKMGNIFHFQVIFGHWIYDDRRYNEKIMHGNRRDAGDFNTSHHFQISFLFDEFTVEFDLFLFLNDFFFRKWKKCCIWKKKTIKKTKVASRIISTHQFFSFFSNFIYFDIFKVATDDTLDNALDTFKPNGNICVTNIT